MKDENEDDEDKDKENEQEDDGMKNKNEIPYDKFNFPSQIRLCFPYAKFVKYRSLFVKILIFFFFLYE